MALCSHSGPVGSSAFAGTHSASHHSTSHLHIRPTAGRSHATRVRHAVWFGVSCVPYARSASGIDFPGNAWEWWGNATGVYARGSLPKIGSVLTFRSNSRMRLGHVAVVSRIINPREIEVDQANWGPGGHVSHDVAVVDVSEDNDWTAGTGRTGRRRRIRRRLSDLWLHIRSARHRDHDCRECPARPFAVTQPNDAGFARPH